MIDFIPLPWKILVIVAMVSSAWFGGYLSGKSSGRADQMADTVAAYQKREKIDAKTSGLETRALCIRLGGLPDQCDELRGMDEKPVHQ